MEQFLTHPWVVSISGFVKGHPVLWFSLLLVIVFLLGINWLANLLPQVDVVRSKILLPIARRYQHKKLVKSAIKSDIRGHVNREIAKMKKYLPTGWAEEMDIDWIKSEEPEALIDDKRTIVRIRPVENQDRNFVNAAYHYLKSSFFPKTQAVIPKPHYEASVLHVCRKIVEGRGNSAKTIFEDHILEPAIERHGNIPVHLDDYSHLDTRGFFTGTFLRELHLMAIDARFTGARNKMTEETGQVIKHIKDFIQAYESEEDIPASAWNNNGTVSKYAILLVANPAKTRWGVDAYINRARGQFQSGARRLYVFGSNQESRFANAVISAIAGAVENIHLVEKFQTPSDYRGKENGIGAVFEFRERV